MEIDQFTLLTPPDFFDPQKVGTVWRIPYEERAKQARDWARQYGMLACLR